LAGVAAGALAGDRRHGASALAIALVWPTMKSELSPMEDRGVILANINAPDGSTLDYTDRYAQALERMGQQYPEFDRIFANVGNPTVSQGNVVPHGRLGRAQAQHLDMARELGPSSTRCRASTPSRSRRRRWGRASATGR
jgi:multidrug efflux pump subunit AcrB